MAAERALEAERRAHKATESRAAQTAAETQVLKSQLQNIQEAHSAAEAQWEADRIAAAVATASALDESSRWEAEAARWEAEAARWEAKVRDQGEQLELLELQLEREIDNLLDEFCDTEDGYRQVVEKQRKARHRAERQTEAAETALNAVREVAEAELSKGPEYLTDEAADSALNVVREVAEGQEFLASSIRMGTLEDLRTLTSEAHARGIYVLIDIVVNHMANELSFDGRTGGTPFAKHGAEYRLRPRDGSNVQPYRDYYYNNTWDPQGTYTGKYLFYD